MAPVIPALWLVFALDLAVLGVIVALVAWRPSPVGRLILPVAVLSPLGAAGLQLRTIGFVPPTAILLTLGLLTMAAAVVLVPARQRAEPGGSSARSRFGRPATWRTTVLPAGTASRKRVTS